MIYFYLKSENNTRIPIFTSQQSYGSITTGSNTSRLATSVLPKINSSDDLNLKNNDVPSEVKTSGSITAWDTKMISLNADGNIRIVNSEISNEIIAGRLLTATTIKAQSISAARNISITDSIVLGEVKARNEIMATRCSVLDSVNAEKAIYLEKCTSVRSIQTGGSLTLQNVTVQENVSSEARTTIQNSTINGTLTCSSENQIINNSKIDTIILNCIINRKNFPQILNLYNSTVRNIIFGGGRGVVILSKESAVTGHIVGGKINERIT